MYHSAKYNEPLLNQLTDAKIEKIQKVEKMPKSLQRTKKIGIPNLD